MTARRITLRIDRITVEGRRPSRAALAEAIRRELGGLLSAPGGLEGLQRGRELRRLDGGRIAAEGPGDAAFGRAMARATYGVLKR